MRKRWSRCEPGRVIFGLGAKDKLTQGLELGTSCWIGLVPVTMAVLIPQATGGIGSLVKLVTLTLARLEELILGLRELKGGSIRGTMTSGESR